MTWQTKKLGEVCEIGAGNSAPQKKEFFVGGKYPFFRTSDVGRVKISKSLSQVEDYLNDKGIKNLRLFKKGTILIPKSGASTFLNHRVIMGIDGYVASHLATIKTDESILDSNFLFYFLQEIKVQDLIQDHKYPSLNLPVIEKIEISFPLLAEQKRIVKLLDEVFDKTSKAKENTEKNLQNSKELFDAYLENTFVQSVKSWKLKSLKEIGQTQTGLTPNTSDRSYFGNYIPFIKPADVDTNGDGSIRYDNEGLSIHGLKVGRKINKNSVLMVCIGASIGKVGFSDIDVSCNQQINTLTPASSYDPKFFYYALRTKDFFNKVIENSSQATLPIINKTKWENLKVAFPEALKEQSTIVKKLDMLLTDTKKLEENYQCKLIGLGEFKKSILREAFTNSL